MDSPVPDILPRIILSGRSLVHREVLHEAAGAAFENGAPGHNTMEVLREARAQGCGAVCAVGDEGLANAIHALRAENNNPAVPPFQILPLIPNVLGYVREATEHGLAGAGMRRVLRTGLGGVLRASLTGFLNAPGVLRKQFPAAMEILYDLEMGEFHSLRPPVVFLHQTITDMAVAFGNRKLLSNFARAMRGRYHTEPGFATTNFAALADRLREWNIEVSWILAPYNRERYLMPLGQEAYQKVFDRGGIRLVADRVSPVIPTPQDAVDWALAQPAVASVVIDKLD